MGDDDNWRRFEQLAMPHLDAAYNLALWITRNADDAQDVVQDALMRAMRYMASLRLENARPWLLQIVRHTCYTWLKENRPQEKVLLDDPEDAWRDLADASSAEPPAIAIRKAEREQINAAIAALPVGYREVFVLRELEELPYHDIARIAEVPIGTVMSRLSRARGLMRAALAPIARPALRTVPRPAQAGSKP
jgi:RNA polymerase sigma-70 factor (ECF subfamily)